MVVLGPHTAEVAGTIETVTYLAYQLGGIRHSHAIKTRVEQAETARLRGTIQVDEAPPQTTIGSSLEHILGEFRRHIGATVSAVIAAGDEAATGS